MAQHEREETQWKKVTVISRIQREGIVRSGDLLSTAKYDATFDGVPASVSQRFLMYGRETDRIKVLSQDATADQENNRISDQVLRQVEISK